MLLDWCKKCLESAHPVSSTPFNLKIIILSGEEGMAKGAAAEYFPTFAYTALCLESSSPLLLTIENLSSIVLYNGSNNNNSILCTYSDLGTVQGMWKWMRPGSKLRALGPHLQYGVYSDGFSHGLRSQTAWVQTLAPTLSDHLAHKRFFNCSVLQFSHLWCGMR